MLLEISGEITPERMKRWSQSKTTLDVDVTGDGNDRSDASKSSIAWEPGMLGP